ncbi:50S ribosomal protein L13 [Candidatus Azambacteria bacterium RIFCSPHIGHO2_02_FULL_52_12]|uniref:Large ribosomal subunit protein uL13 n=1 Tax=Candidatus Azambacteria bacterium RIFCSPLOWO2_01_FULL_46_25 TaxID=1797298 RepID=A0A1F5BTE2_9BACT|nr:MAG: 50S ribosomal protein L13 [Candidatus Azambacteria bacterium RIFCSPHIGHO2_02_FULL_52_12]OGD33890.1 MAG: 50S ribosomal protein L13 [Candidatus Azambacteria bacterium RIFCSPLOWO2_01_FULL_46_25]OGD37960.1 MAG: 50S ribosomal protein L13 [Candidatus Azambacteria bacterium RIFCSPHIGHO2_01_FULL_51_74]
MKNKERNAHTIDATDKSLGRLATEVALLLMGKNKATFQRHIDGGDSVDVFNFDAVKITGNKREQKTYYRHSGYPGGLKEEKLKNLLERNPGEVLKKAVYGMLPKNKLRPLMIKRLTTHRKEIAS